MQEVYDKKVLHRLVGVPPRATVVQDVHQVNGIERSNESIVQSAWEPTERSPERDDECHTQKPGLSTKTGLQEVIDVDADDDESRYEIARKRRRKAKEVIAVESSEEGGSVAEEMGNDEEDKKGGQVKINRKRAFWAAKAGTSSAGLGT